MPPHLHPIALIAALPQEAGPLLRRLRARRLRNFSFPAWEFRTTIIRGLVALGGMGAAAALAVAEELLPRYAPGALLSVGFAGALTPDLRVGDLVVGEAFYRLGSAGGPERLPDPPAFRAVAPLVASLRLAGLAAWAGACLEPPALLPKQVLRDPAAGLSCPVVDLESAPLAALAAARGLPFLALRAVSDLAHEEMPPFIAQAVAKSRAPTLRDAARWLREDPRRLSVLLGLWRQSWRAARRLAKGVGVALEMVGNSGGGPPVLS